MNRPLTLLTTLTLLAACEKPPPPEPAPPLVTVGDWAALDRTARREMCETKGDALACLDCMIAARDSKGGAALVIDEQLAVCAGDQEAANDALNRRQPPDLDALMVAPSGPPSMRDWGGLSKTKKIQHCQTVTSGFLQNDHCRVCMDALGSSRSKSLASGLQMCGRSARR